MVARKVRAIISEIFLSHGKEHMFVCVTCRKAWKINPGEHSCTGSATQVTCIQDIQDAFATRDNESRKPDA